MNGFSMKYLVALVSLFLLIVSYFLVQPPHLNNFTYHSLNKSFVFDVSDYRPYFVQVKSEVPLKLDREILTPHTDDEFLGFFNREVKINNKYFELNHEYSVFVYSSTYLCGLLKNLAHILRQSDVKCQMVYFFEIIMQPPFWLKKNFNWQSDMGYSILGRRNIENHSVQVNTDIDLIFKKNVSPKLNLTSFRAIDLSLPTEIRYASSLLSYLWKQDILIGPTTKSYAHFLNKSFDEKLIDLKKNDFAVMCQGVRDLFLHALSSRPELKVRAVEAYNYYPAFKDLQTYSHATVEIFLAREKKFVLIDPWFGFALKIDNQWLSAEDLLTSLHNLERVEIVPLVKETRKKYIGSQGPLTLVSHPESVQLNRFSKDDISYYPPYLMYFGHVIYKNVKILDESR